MSSTILPTELILAVLDWLDDDVPTLRSCAIVHSSWLSPVRARLFRTLPLDAHFDRPRDTPSADTAANGLRILPLLPSIAPYVHAISAVGYYATRRYNDPSHEVPLLTQHLATIARHVNEYSHVDSLSLWKCSLEGSFSDPKSAPPEVLQLLAGIKNLELQSVDVRSADILHNLVNACPKLEQLSIRGFFIRESMGVGLRCALADLPSANLHSVDFTVVESADIGALHQWVNEASSIHSLTMNLWTHDFLSTPMSIGSIPPLNSESLEDLTLTTLGGIEPVTFRVLDNIETPQLKHLNVRIYGMQRKDLTPSDWEKMLDKTKFPKLENVNVLLNRESLL